MVGVYVFEQGHGLIVGEDVSAQGLHQPGCPII